MEMRHRKITMPRNSICIILAIGRKLAEEKYNYKSNKYEDISFHDISFLHIDTHFSLHLRPIPVNAITTLAKTAIIFCILLKSKHHNNLFLFYTSKFLLKLLALI